LASLAFTVSRLGRCRYCAAKTAVIQVDAEHWGCC